MGEQGVRQLVRWHGGCPRFGRGGGLSMMVTSFSPPAMRRQSIGWRSASALVYDMGSHRGRASALFSAPAAGDFPGTWEPAFYGRYGKRARRALSSPRDDGRENAGL